jgi:hypothetical protein
MVTLVAESSHEASLVILAGAERVQVTGRAAVIIAQIAANASALNRIRVGRLVADFAHDKSKLELTESLPAVRAAS